MARELVFAVFCYDVSRDRARTRLATLLEEDATRVQESVFEGWMREVRAKGLAKRAARLIGPDDKLRVYLIGRSDAVKTINYGASVPVETDDFHLF